jgi:dipeptidyl aminopeptidase/acylaminoacyl peptidase
MRKVMKPGEWKSPLTAAMLAEAGIIIGWTQTIEDDLWWDETRPSEGGRTVIVSLTHGDILPAPWSAQSRVHEYGGISWLGFVRDGNPILAFINKSDQRIYLTEPMGEPTPITPLAAEFEMHRYIEMILVGDEIWCIRERHRDSKVTRDLIAISQKGIRSLESSSHFYSHPRISPDGKHLAWISWEHPLMPWDGTELRVGDVDQGQLTNVRVLTGSQEISSLSPEWATNDLIYFICDKSGWWNLWKIDLRGIQTQIIKEKSEWGYPLWKLGLRFIVILKNGKILCEHGPVGSRRMTIVDPEDKIFSDIASELNNFKPTFSIHENKAYVVGSGTSSLEQLVEIDLEILKVSAIITKTEPPVDPRYFPKPREIQITGKNGRAVFAILHPAQNPDFTESEKVPLMVVAHGGPTDHESASVKLIYTYFTSRGISVIDVNYGGSTGYGREYRNVLRGQWGIIDREDVISVVDALIHAGLADKEKILIRGGSAGGFTVLNALVNSDDFAAGASHFGVGDCIAFAAETHDFESRYLDSMIGLYPEQEILYKQRSPITHADHLSSPLIIFQGLDDKVVPPAQSEAFRDICAKRGIKHEYMTFEGEGHGFQKATSIIACAEAELKFYGEVLGFQPTY